MKKLKVVTVIGTRPEIIRLARVMSKLDKYCDHIIVHTGQNYDYELNEIFFKDLNVRKPDYFLDAAGNNGAKTIGKVIIAIDAMGGENSPKKIIEVIKISLKSNKENFFYFALHLRIFVYTKNIFWPTNLLLSFRI